MHNLLNHITKFIKITLLLIFSFFFISSNSNANLTAEDIIKSRKALFSKNYSTAKRVQAFSAKGDFKKAKKLMIEMSENYKVLLDLFPENTQEGFKTEALKIIWEEKDSYNALMQKASDDMIKLTSLIENTGSYKTFIFFLENIFSSISSFLCSAVLQKTNEIFLLANFQRIFLKKFNFGLPDTLKRILVLNLKSKNKTNGMLVIK